MWHLSLPFLPTVNKQMLALKKNANGNPMAWNGTKVRASKPTAGKMDLARLSLYDDKGGPDELQQEVKQIGCLLPQR